MTAASVSTTAVEDLLRLAWLAAGEGKPGMRDALLTLAVAESGPEDAVLAERCRRLLVVRQPDHWFATTATLGQALNHPRVAGALTKLRAMFPPVRIHRILMRAEVQRGPFTGEPVPLAQVLEELGLVPERATSQRERVRDRRPAPVHAVPFPTPSDPGPLEPPAIEESEAAVSEPSEESLAPLYLALLFAMAVLVQTVREQRNAAREERDAAGTRAA